MKCDQNCGKDAEWLLLDGDDHLHFLCGEHENELARMDGESNISIWLLSASPLVTISDLVEIFNRKMDYWDKRYGTLLKKYIEVERRSE